MCVCVCWCRGDVWFWPLVSCPRLFLSWWTYRPGQSCVVYAEIDDGVGVWVDVVLFRVYAERKNWDRRVELLPRYFSWVFSKDVGHFFFLPGCFCEIPCEYWFFIYFISAHKKNKKSFPCLQCKTPIYLLTYLPCPLLPSFLLFYFCLMIWLNSWESFFPPNHVLQPNSVIFSSRDFFLCPSIIRPPPPTHPFCMFTR